MNKKFSYLFILCLVLVSTLIINGCVIKKENSSVIEENINFEKQVLEPFEFLESEVGVKYDSKISYVLNNTLEAEILVRLIDKSNVTIEGREEDRDLLQTERVEWFKPIIANVLDSLPESEVKNVRKRFNGFSATITKNGFEALLKNPNVEKISIYDTAPPGI